MHLHCWILYISLNGQSIKQILHKMGGCSESLLLAVSLVFGEFTDTFVVLWVLLFIMEGCLWERETWLVYLEVIREWFIDNIEVHLEQITEEAPDLNLFWGCMPCRDLKKNRRPNHNDLTHNINSIAKNHLTQCWCPFQASSLSHFLHFLTFSF